MNKTMTAATIGAVEARADVSVLNFNTTTNGVRDYLIR